MSRTTIFCGCFAVVLAVSLTANGSSVPQYSITDLGTLGSDAGSYGLAINAGGAVCGSTGAPGWQSFVYSGGTMQSLGVGYDNSSGSSISDNGLIAGTYHTASHYMAYLYNGGTVQSLGMLASGGSVFDSSFGRGVNSAGQVVGQTDIDGGARRAFLYSGGVMQDLGTLGGRHSQAEAINESGQITGTAEDASGNSRAFLYSGGAMQNLGTIADADWACGMALNASGQVVGYGTVSSDDDIEYAFLYSGGAMHNLGTLGGLAAIALDINDDGVIVGSSSLAGDLVEHAFIYNGGTMQDLNDLIDPASGWTLTYARGINANGLITGYGVNSAGETHAFVLTPLPEPASVLLLGLAGLGIMRRRKA